MLRSWLPKPVISLISMAASSSCLIHAALTEHHRSGHQQIDQGERQTDLPAHRHDLVIARAWQRTTNQDEQHDKKQRLENEPECRRQEWTVPATEEERHHPWLWRFWRRLPKYGHITLFDRSWYGRVLVEVIERFITPADQQRAYTEINDFENQLLKNGTLVIKFWLAITRDEQLKRFREREQVAFQNHKLTPEDWRNRRQWKAYDAAIAEMVQHTHTPACPWVLIPSNDVEHARIEVLKTLCMRLEAHLNRR